MLLVRDPPLVGGGGSHAHLLCTEQLSVNQHDLCERGEMDKDKCADSAKSMFAD
jgi:hypothetical protein